MSFGGECFHNGPHGLVRREDVPPGVEEGLGINAAAKALNGPLDILGLGDATGFEVVFPLNQGFQPNDGIGSVGGEQPREGGFKVEVKQDTADVEEEGHWGRSGK